MIRRKTRQIVFHSFSGKKPEPDKATSMLLLRSLTHEDPEIRQSGARGLALICIAHLGQENEISESLLRLFEYNARYSQFDDVREECIDALAECRALGRLRSLTFEIGCNDTRRYRDKVLRRLEQEIC